MSLIILESIFQKFIEESEQRQLEIDRGFAQQYIYLLVHDSRLGLNIQKLNDFKIQQFINDAIGKYIDPLDATICNLRLSYFFKNCKALNPHFVKFKCEYEFKTKLQFLLDNILQYPETCNKEQLERLSTAMLTFIITNYSIGDPKNSVLLELAGQSLNSILGKNHLRKYICKKKYHRLEYLQRLSATVCGILIYNNQNSNKCNEHISNLFGNIDNSLQKTKESLDGTLKNAVDCKILGCNIIESSIQINIQEKNVHCRYPIEKVREVNKFVALYSVYERFLRQLIELYQRIQYLIDISKNIYQCVINKIYEILQYRTAVESEAIFPHFVYLSEVWNSLNFHFNFLTEISNVENQLNTFVSPKLEQKFQDIVVEIKMKNTKQNYSRKHTFLEINERLNNRDHHLQYSNISIKQDMHEYCALTIALTDGLLIPATIKRNLCVNSKFKFGFKNTEFAKYAERYFENYLKMLKSSILSTIDLILLCNAEQDIMNQNLKCDNIEEQSVIVDNGTQTEFHVENDLRVRNKINVAWNSWDFHRETICMANLRKKQTKSAQTLVSYGQRNTHNQKYNTRSHI